MDTSVSTLEKKPISSDEFIASLTPKEIVVELNKFIVGQNKAKLAVAIALRNRWRSQQLSEDIREEVAPKNIARMSPTCATFHLDKSLLNVIASKNIEVMSVTWDTSHLDKSPLKALAL